MHLIGQSLLLLFGEIEGTFENCTTNECLFCLEHTTSSDVDLYVMENGTILQYTITRQSVSVSMPQTAQSTALLIYSQLASVSLKIALWHILMFHSHRCSRNNVETNIHLDWWQLNNFWIVLCNQESISRFSCRKTRSSQVKSSSFISI